jgi:hypothetical protein
VSQRQILENSINLMKTLRGPAKILYAASGVGFPTLIDNVINPTTGAPGASWVPFGLTRGGINVSKNLDIAVRDDVDQILGAYDQDITDRSYTITTQLAEILQDTMSQIAVAADMGAATVVVATSGAPTQTMRPLDDGDNKTEERRWAVIYPKSTNGKLFAFVFRRGAVSGGEKAFRFDKSDPASPPLEIRMFPEIATTIAPEDAYGRAFEIE